MSKLLLENGFNFLLEDGNFFLLETISINKNFTNVDIVATITYDHEGITYDDLNTTYGGIFILGWSGQGNASTVLTEQNNVNTLLTQQSNVNTLFSAYNSDQTNFTGLNDI